MEGRNTLAYLSGENTKLFVCVGTSTLAYPLPFVTEKFICGEGQTLAFWHAVINDTGT
jgi:hypothetical protein